jgi:hypothetical protein
MTMTGAADCAERRQGVRRRIGRMNLIARDKGMGAKVPAENDDTDPFKK